MARIVPKLNLNKTPQLVENNSLVFAKNIRILPDGTIGPDTSLEEIETNTGDVTHHSVHHNDVVQQVTRYFYTILQYKEVLALSNGGSLTANPEYDFSIDSQSDPYDDNYKLSDRATYANRLDVNQCSISCYDLGNVNTVPMQPVWVQPIFTYNRLDNRLEDNGGLMFLIGIREEEVNNTTLANLHAPRFFYFVGPRWYEGTTLNDVFDTGANYVVFNPVYQTSTTNTTIIQPAYDEEWDTYDTVRYIAQIVGLNNKIYFFKESNYIKFTAAAKTAILAEYTTECFVGDTPATGQTITFDVDANGYVTRNGILFRDSTIAATLFPNFNARVKIFEYDEVANTFRIVECGWKYSGGEINGCTSVNGTGETILTICEYDEENNQLVPVKHININVCSENDDESFYTQAPNIPISNLRLSGRYIKNIPAGVYQFFIRYKIRENFYTNWFPCSKELFAGSRKIIDTLQGSIKHTDLHEDSNNSFIFTIEHLYPQYCSEYEQFQLGFILSSDGGVFARSWKHFDMTLASAVSIYFDYNKEDIEEVNIDELLKVNYNIFNVKNVTQYKNKIYIGNYIESDFNNPTLQAKANEIKITFDLYEVARTGIHYLNSIPLENAVNGIYTTFGNRHIREIYYDSVYCNVTKTKDVSVALTLSLGQYPAGAYIQNGFVFLPKIKKVSLIDDNNDTYDLVEYFSTINLVPYADHLGIDIENEQYDTVIDAVIDMIKPEILGIDSNGGFKIDINGSTKTITSFSIEYITFGEQYREFGIDEDAMPVYNYYQDIFSNIVTVNVSLKTNMFTTSYQYNEYNTFLPFTKYDFYVHYVTQNGIITNGYSICTKEVNRYCKQYKPIPTPGAAPASYTELSDSDDINDLCWYTPDTKEYAVLHDAVNGDQWYKLDEITTDNYIIIPNIDNIKCPDGYVGCFISYSKYGNNVAEGYNYDNEYDSNANQTVHKIDCLDLNCLLYNVNTNIKVKSSQGNIITDSANYYSSSTTNPLEYLGGSGHVEFITNGNDTIVGKCWLIIDASEKPYNKQLIKLTPFIKLNTTSPVGYADFTDVNSPGYFCEIITLNREYCNYPNGYYVSGNDIYTRQLNSSNTLTVAIEEGRVEYNPTIRQYHYIFSNFNLNYVSLTSDLTPIIRRYNIVRDGDDPTTNTHVEEGTIESSEKQLITVVNSLLASYILELKSYYREYTRKLYQTYDKNKFTQFDNTVRVSSVDTDELYRYIYRFEATDYYNVPTQRGIITNLIAVANTLYVHCEHSLFKFTDNKTLNTQQEDVVLQENDIFNSGISEVFDAQYGYGGLEHRRHSLITFNAYVFYDSVTNIVYAFGGEQQIANIGESIQKVINAIKPIDVLFAADEINDRFFVNFKTTEGNVCLSFNFKNKAFVAIHDIDFTKAFHSRRHTYFIHDNTYNGTAIGWSIYRIVDRLTINDVDYFIAYQNCYTPSLISIGDMPIPTGYKTASACIDVITNVQFEAIKVLNYINWICSEIQEYGCDFNYVAEEELNRLYAGDKLRLYSDSTSTELFDLVDGNGNAKISNEQRNIDINGALDPVKESWQYPAYNCGVFSLNYFRDIIRNGNIYNTANPDLFDYKNADGIGQGNLVDLNEYTQRKNLTQENTLVYGKYFVCRIICTNRNFKIENITFRMSDYGKTK